MKEVFYGTLGKPHFYHAMGTGIGIPRLARETDEIQAGWDRAL